MVSVDKSQLHWHFPVKAVEIIIVVVSGDAAYNLHLKCY